jgi:hypothetical protein
MLPDNLSQHSLAAAVEAFDAEAVLGGKRERNELTLEIATAKIVSICGFLKYDQEFVRLSTVTRWTGIRTRASGGVSPALIVHNGCA